MLPAYVYDKVNNIVRSKQVASDKFPFNIIFIILFIMTHLFSKGARITYEI